MNVTATVEVNVKQVDRLLVFILTVNSIRDAMTLNFGDLNALLGIPGLHLDE